MFSAEGVHVFSFLMVRFSSCNLVGVSPDSAVEFLKMFLPKVLCGTMNCTRRLRHLLDRSDGAQIERWFNWLRKTQKGDVELAVRCRTR